MSPDHLRLRVTVTMSDSQGNAISRSSVLEQVKHEANWKYGGFATWADGEVQRLIEQAEMARERLEIPT